MSYARIESRNLLPLIALFKIVKALLLLAVAIGLIRLLHKDIADEIYRWANTLRVDPGNRLIQNLLGQVYLLDSKRLQALGAGTFFYSGLFFTEGIGLFLQKRWAEYLTIIVTCSFIPVEIYEIVRSVTFARVFVLILNIAIVIYLAIHLRHVSSRKDSRP